jgi:Bifunctional DNA primase/polymerase, N-terminal
MDTDTRQQARLLALGLSVIPVPRPRPDVPTGQPGDGKVPAIAWKEFQTRLPTEAELVAWFSGAPMNLTVITGHVSGVVVIDLDSPAALEWARRRLPYTCWQTQTARGFHVWYRHPGVRVANRARLDTGDGPLAIDVRGDGGFAIAPGSIHASGVEYGEAGDWSAPKRSLPVFWPGWLARPQTHGTRATGRAPRVVPLTGTLVERAGRYLAAIPPPEIGCGSDNATLYAACRLVRGFGLSASDAETLLWDWAGGRPGWTREWIAEKVAHAERYGTEPIGALR